MKKLLLLSLFTIAFITTKAQSDSTLQQYTGKYKFADGPFTEMTLSLDNGVLTAVSSIGSSEFKATSTVDVFEIVAYQGTATFKRKDGVVIGVLIQAQGLTMEGVKSNEK